VPHIPIRDFMNVRQQLRWLRWLGLWLLADYCLRGWMAGPSSDTAASRLDFR
jgi:hypothetical protein